MRYTFIFAGLLALVAVPACSAAPAAEDEGDGSDAAEAAGALSSNVNSGYFVVTRQDNRKCMSPVCGGVFVKRVNANKTRCMDAIYRTECYVGNVNLAALGLSDNEASDFRGVLDEGKGLVRAAFAKNAMFPQIAELKVAEGWEGATGSTPSGTYYRAADNGIRCITAPCPSTSAFKLNSATSQHVNNVDLEGTATPADADTLAAAGDALGTKTGVLVAGGISTTKCVPQSSSCGTALRATEFYLPVQHSTLGQSCGGRGQQLCSKGQYCSWEPKDICGMADAPGKCAAKTEMCSMIYQPVCGCDGKTYSSACVAASRGISVASKGACKTAN